MTVEAVFSLTTVSFVLFQVILVIFWGASIQQSQFRPYKVIVRIIVSSWFLLHQSIPAPSFISPVTSSTVISLTLFSGHTWVGVSCTAWRFGGPQILGFLGHVLRKGGGGGAKITYQKCKPRRKELVSKA